MTRILPPVRLTGALLLRDGVLQPRSLALAEGRITKGPLPEIDMRGYYLLPGIVDLHGDAFERHIAPRRSAGFDLRTGLESTDRDAAAHGVTTAWLAQSWSWEGGKRGPDAAEALLAAHAAYRGQMGTDMRVQIRCETHLVDSGPRLLAAVERYGVDYVVFNNHLDDAVETARMRPAQVALWAEQEGVSYEHYMATIAAAMERRREVPRHLCRLAEEFDRLGVVYGSHDDPDGETRETYHRLGARITEFPTRRRAAAVAKALNDPVLMGAPNVVRGGSQSGNVAALDLIEDGLCDALVSDYYYPALARAAWALVDAGLKDLPAAWAMISTAPAQILGLTDRGVLDVGKRADLVAVNVETRSVEMTVAGGVVTYVGGGAARRLAGAEMPAAISAAAE